MKILVFDGMEFGFRGLCVILTFDNFVVDFIEFGGCHLDEAGFAAVDAHEHL